MPGFLSNYTQITTITFEGDYWVKVRRFLRRGDFKAAQLALVQPEMRSVDQEGDNKDDEQKMQTTGKIDTGAYQDELVCRALIDWNLTDEDNAPIPLGIVDPVKGPDATRLAAVALLPEEVFEKLLTSIEGAGKKKKPDETDPFRTTGEAGPVSRKAAAR